MRPMLNWSSISAMDRSAAARSSSFFSGTFRSFMAMVMPDLVANWKPTFFIRPTISPGRRLSSWEQEVLGGEHYLARLRHRGSGERHVDGHLVAIEVGVEGGAHQRVDLDGAAVDEHRLPPPGGPTGAGGGGGGGA